MQRRWVVWLLVFAGWTALAIFFAVSSSLTFVAAYRAPRWGFTLLMALTEWYAWAALTPLVAWLASRFPLRAGRLHRSLPVHVVAGLILAIVKVTVTRVLRFPLETTTGYFLISNLATHYVIYWALVAAVHALAYYRAGREGELRASQLEARLSQARLQLLANQIHPHFLFNTLNAISELVHEDPSAADRMIASLSELLRETLDAGSADRVPLARELALLDRYLDIQRARFGDRLDVRTRIDPGAQGVLVPHLILQPLVENSIRHGLAARINAGRIEIRALHRADTLVIEVEDDGAGFDESGGREGVGLGNTRARLEALYGRGQSVETRNTEAGGALVRLVMPWTEGTAMTLRVLVVDDEPVARRRLRRLLREAPDVEVVGEAGDGRNAVDAIRLLSPDLALLDVQMPEMDGFEVLQAVGADQMPACIFVTAFDRYALRAFDVHALDYLLKPVDGARLQRALDRARTRVAERRGARGDPGVLALLNDLAAGRRFLTRFPVRTGGRLLVIDLSDVDRITAADNYVTLHVGREQYVARETMNRLERELDPSRFVRIHRSTIVAVDRIKELVPDFHGDFTVTLKNGTRVTLTRSYRARLAQALGREI